VLADGQRRNILGAVDADPRTAAAGPVPSIIPSRNISPDRIDPDALKVVRRLQRFGFQAYLVGGCVRDLLLHRTPKDFDVATSALPNQVRKVFRNCRLIGRRFRLAHIHFQKKIIETATFRACDPDTGQNPDDPLIRSDNVFGTQSEDALRRDFTCNALFYDPVARELIDYVGGLEDLVSRTIRFIGPPALRVREDPVRILRAIKFAARLGFSIDPPAWAAMVRYRHELIRSAPARVLEEVLRMLRGGAAETSFRLMWQAGLLDVLLPEVAAFLARAPERGEIRDPGIGMWAYLRAADRWRREPLSDPVLLAALFLHPMLDAHRNGGRPYDLGEKPGGLGEVAGRMMRGLVARLHLPKWQVERIQQIVSLQKRLSELRRADAIPRWMNQRAHLAEALDLLQLGFMASGAGEAALVRLGRLEGRAAPPAQPPRRKRRRRSRRPSPVASPADQGSGA